MSKVRMYKPLVKPPVEYRNFKSLLVALIFFKHSATDYSSHLDIFSIRNHLVPGETEQGSLSIAIKNSYSKPGFDGNLFTYLSELLNVKIGNIEIDGWQETVSGCETCGDGSKSEAGISVKQISYIDTIDLELKAERLLQKLNMEYAAEEAEENRIAQEENDKRNREESERKRLREIETAKINIWLNTFTINKDRILEKALSFYESTKTLDKKSFAVKYRETPYFALAARIRGLRNKTQADILVCWEKYAEKQKHRLELAEAFANSKD